MRFGTDPDQVAIVQWYFCKPGALPLGFPTPFVSRRHDFHEIWPEIGEVQFARRVRTPHVGLSPAPGTHAPCGDPHVWASGYPGRVPPDYPRNAFGLSLCCAGPMGEVCLDPEGRIIPCPGPAVIPLPPLRPRRPGPPQRRTSYALPVAVPPPTPRPPPPWVPAVVPAWAMPAAKPPPAEQPRTLAVIRDVAPLVLPAYVSKKEVSKFLGNLLTYVPLSPAEQSAWAPPSRLGVFPPPKDRKRWHGPPFVPPPEIPMVSCDLCISGGGKGGGDFVPEFFGGGKGGGDFEPTLGLGGGEGGGIIIAPYIVPGGGAGGGVYNPDLHP